MHPVIDFNPDQRFACRDCPARCCKNWSITASAAEIDSLLALPWVRERLAEAGLEPKRIGGPASSTFRLPMRAKGRELRCVFLDDDDLCSIHRREGHDRLPAICQSYPFSFVLDQSGSARVSLSTYCPSIRDNYGEPLAGQIQTKFSQASPFLVHLPETLALGPHLLAQHDYLKLADFWIETFNADLPPAFIIGALRDHLTVLQDTLGPLDPSEAPKPNPAQLPENWQLDAAKLLPDLLAQQQLRLGSYQPDRFPLPTRLILASLLIALADPTFRAIVQPRPYRFLPGIIRNMLAFASGSLSLHLEGIEPPVRFNAAAWRIRGPRPEDETFIRQSLVAGLQSRIHFARADSLPEILFLLAAGLAVVHLYARLRASAHHRSAVNSDDIRQAVSIADKVCLRHGNLLRVLPATRFLLGLLANLPNAHERLLAASLPDPR